MEKEEAHDILAAEAFADAVAPARDDRDQPFAHACTGRPAFDPVM